MSTTTTRTSYADFKAKKEADPSYQKKAAKKEAKRVKEAAESAAREQAFQSNLKRLTLQIPANFEHGEGSRIHAAKVEAAKQGVRLTTDMSGPMIRIIIDTSRVMEMQYCQLSFVYQAASRNWIYEMKCYDKYNSAQGRARMIEVNEWAFDSAIKAINTFLNTIAIPAN